MIDVKTKYLGGFVFQKSSKNILLQELFLQMNIQDFKISVEKNKIKEHTEWIAGKISTRIPFKGEDTPPPYEYNFYFIEKDNATLSILLTENKDLANKLLREIHNLNVTMNPIKINTENILNKVGEYTFYKNQQEERFVINYLYAKTLGMQDKLSSITLYGKDVLKSPLFISYKETFNPLTCGLAVEETSYSFSEISRVSNDGFISFHVGEEVFENVRIVTEFIHATKSFIIT